MHRLFTNRIQKTLAEIGSWKNIPFSLFVFWNTGGGNRFLFVFLFFLISSLSNANDLSIAPINYHVFNLECDNNTTPNDPSDDTFTFSLLTSNTGSTSGWNTTINTIPVSGNYDQVYNLGPYPISAGNINFTLVDQVDLTSTGNVIVIPPSTCSDTCKTYTIIRTWTATDDCDNTAVENQTVEVQDTTAPTISVQAQDISVQCDGDGNYTDLQNWINTQASAEATDSCGSVNWTSDFTVPAVACGSPNPISVVLSATDAC